MSPLGESLSITSDSRAESVSWFSVDSESWPLVAPMVEKLIPRLGGRFLIEDIAELVEQKKLTAWAVAVDGELSGVVLLEINQYPRKKVLTVFGLAGHNLDAWYPSGIGHVKQFATQVGAQAITGMVRPGLAKYLRKRGWEPRSAELELADA